MDCVDHFGLQGRFQDGLGLRVKEGGLLVAQVLVHKELPGRDDVDCVGWLTLTEQTAASLLRKLGEHGNQSLDRPLVKGPKHRQRLQKVDLLLVLPVLHHLPRPVYCLLGKGEKVAVRKAPDVHGFRFAAEKPKLAEVVARPQSPVEIFHRYSVGPNINFQVILTDL